MTPLRTLPPPAPPIRTVRVLGPDARPSRPLPRWAPFGLLPVMVLGAVSPFAPATKSAMPIALLVAIVSGCALAGWLEQRIYHDLRSKRLVVRVLVGLLLPVMAPVVATVCGIALHAVMHALGTSAWAMPVFGFSGLWLAGSATGSFIILLIDAVVSAAVKSFRARIFAAIFCLITVSFLVLLLATVGAVALDEAVQTGSITGNVKLEGPTATAEVSQMLVQLRAHPLLLALGVYGVAAIVALPAAISAIDKLADAVMDRIHPLTMAFDAVARGERDVHLEEGGSKDFVQVSRRFNQMVDALSLGEQMERAFGTYVSQRLLDRIRSQHGAAEIPAQLREATVFFADIRGFTSMSERLSPDAMVALLNRYFERVVALVDEHDGYLNKFIGDAVVVVWNGPVEQPAHAEKATRCAIALQKLVAEMNDAGNFPEVGRLEIGVGVSTGPMVCGNVGSSRQMEYTVIGDTVNLAARLTSKAGPGEVWISENTARALPPELPVAALEPMKVKGKDVEVRPARVWPIEDAVAKAG